MIEAVNSVISNVQAARSATDQLSSVRAVEANAVVATKPVERPVAPFISPYISVDVNFDKAVIQIRDSDTGDVVNQFPSEQTLASRQRAQALQTGPEQQVQQNTQQSSSQNVEAPQSTTFVASEVSVQSSAPAGAAAAQVAITALSTGAQSGVASTAIINTSV